MNIADYLVDYLIKKGITDVFGIPGGVILDFIYALDKRKSEINTHLMFHEHNATFAASGYAQITQKIGVAFATKGPGILNMTTAIADAYYDSVPILIITSHALEDTNLKMRIVQDQELNTIPIFSSITKSCIRIETREEFISEFFKAVEMLSENRKGPIILDICSKIWNQEIDEKMMKEFFFRRPSYKVDEACTAIESSLKIAERPVLLIGNGVRDAKAEKEVVQFAVNNNLPVIYSRGCQDIIGNSEMSFGYLGSHGIRYANFILSKADLLISLGNRMSFPPNSKSFLDIFKTCKVIRCDIDESEFLRELPNSDNYICDVGILLRELNKKKFEKIKHTKWLNVCKHIKGILYKNDTESPVGEIAYLLDNLEVENVITSDVGNNEFWLSRAYELSSNKSRILYSRSLGVMGCSIGRAIGAYYATRNNVICFVGDQGLQMNPQELQFISKNELPVWIIVVNNQSSGMIKSRQIRRFDSEFLLTTVDTGYSVVDFSKLINAYGIKYVRVKSIEDIKSKIFEGNADYTKPLFVDFLVNSEIDLEISLPIGNKCDDMSPKLDDKIYNELKGL